jgi:hypothetical protein
MNAIKTTFIILISLSSAQFTFGQAKEDGFFGQNDPVKSVEIFPNPTAEFLTIKFEAPIAKNALITIHNIIGNEMGLEPEVMDDFELRIRVKNIHEGYYFLAIQNAQSGNKITLKFLKR